jgi:hypothetical protein
MSKFVIRKEIAALINTIKAHSDTIGNKKIISQEEVEVIVGLIEELHKKIVVFEYLNALPEIPEVSVIVDIASIEATTSIEPNEAIELIEEKSAPLVEEKPVETLPETKGKQENSNPSKHEFAKMAIGINDKFQFINELFAGKTQEYETAIQQLNALETKEETGIYFRNLLQANNWKEDHATVKRLLHLANGRFN